MQSADPAVAPLCSGVSPLGRPVAWALSHPATIVVWSAMVAWSVLLGSLVRSEYSSFHLGLYDLGNMTQAVWSTAHGHFLEVTNGTTGVQTVRLGAHVDPILALLAPLWLLWSSPLVLAYTQVVAVALGALPVFWLARRHLASERLACLLAMVYLAYPYLAWNALDAMHPVTLAIPLFLYCVWFLDTDRMWGFVPCAVLVVLTGELLGVTLAALGIWYALARRRRRTGLLITVFGLGWTFVAVYVVVRVFSDGASPFYSYYAALGGSPGGLLGTAIHHPGRVVAAIATWSEGHYVLALSVPLAGLFVLAPTLSAVALPQLLANGLTDLSFTRVPEAHYGAAIIPFLVAGTVLGLARVSARRRWFAVSLLVLAAIASVPKGPWPGLSTNSPPWYTIDDSSKHLDALRKAVALVPAGAPLSSSNKVGAHLAARRYLTLVPVLGHARWAVVDTEDPWIANPRGPLPVRRPGAPARFVSRLESSARWTKVFEEDGVLVFRRTNGR